MKYFILLMSCWLSWSVLPAQISLSLELISDVFDQPVGMANAGDERLFVVERPGRIRILQADGQVAATPFLDIDDQVRSSGGEQGLLGLAFHPDYVDNGYFYVNYINNDRNTVIARFRRSDDDPDRASEQSQKILMTVTQPFSNHNGGDLHFGPDGYLYIGLGDGGSAGDPRDNGQDRLSLLGKMLRIDVDEGDPYGIPEDNPFANVDHTLDEIWALGLRNPWRFSFDRQTGDMWIGDVGQNNWEEVNFQAAGSSGGENYGWRCYEADSAFNLDGCDDRDTYDFPIHFYTSDLPTGCSVNGGFVYRGEAFPLLQGKYLYSDHCSGRIWALEQQNGQLVSNVQLMDGENFNYVSMGEDQRGELYLVGIGGQIYRIRDQTTPATEASWLENLTLSPNPFSDRLVIQGMTRQAGQYQLQLFNALGEKVWQQNRFLESRFQVSLPTYDLAPGVYWLSLTGFGQSSVARRVIRL